MQSNQPEKISLKGSEDNDTDPELPRAFGLFHDEHGEKRIVHTQHIRSCEEVLGRAGETNTSDEERGASSNFLKDASRIVSTFRDMRTDVETPSGKAISRRPNLLVVGGFVRDVLLEKPPKDIDFATNLTYDELERHLTDVWKEDLNAKRVTLKRTGALFPVMRVRFEGGSEYEIATFRTESGITDGRRPEHMETVRHAGKDADRRDLTINALFYNPLSGNVIDFVDGLKDIREKKLRFVGNPNERIAEDTTRMLRYLRFLQKTGFDEDPLAKEAIREHAEKILARPPEQIVQEVEKTFLEGNVGAYLERLHEYGLLKHILPEVEEMERCEQGAPYHMEGHVLKHTMLVANGLPKGASTELCWAAILHDLGKKHTRTEETRPDGSQKVQFLGHEEISADEAREILTHKRFPATGEERRKGRDKILKMIEYHLRIFKLPEMGPGKAEQFIIETKEYFDDLYALATADMRASHGANRSIDEEHERNIVAISETRAKILQKWTEEKSPLQKIYNLVNGNMVQKEYEAFYHLTLTKQQKKVIGDILRAVRARIEERYNQKIVLDEEKVGDILLDVIKKTPLSL